MPATLIEKLQYLISKFPLLMGCEFKFIEGVNFAGYELVFYNKEYNFHLVYRISYVVIGRLQQDYVDNSTYSYFIEILSALEHKLFMHIDKLEGDITRW